MDQHSRNVDSSDTESLPYSLNHSETESLVESVGSIEVESGELMPRPTSRFGRTRKKKSGPQFLEFSKQLPDVPVSAAWEFIRNHRNMSDLAPGVIGHFDYLEGDGNTGSVFIANYTPQFCEKFVLFTDNPDEKYVVNKVEVRDDISHMYAVRCVGGRYQKRYHLYFTFIKVVPDEVLGDGSSVIIWRLQYEQIDPRNPVPHETKMGYTAAIDLIRDRHLSLHRVPRPLICPAVSAAMSKRLKRQAHQRRRIGADQPAAEDSLELKMKARAQLPNKGVDAVDRDCPKQRTARRRVRVRLPGKSSNEESDSDAQTMQGPRSQSRAQLKMKDKKADRGYSRRTLEPGRKGSNMFQGGGRGVKVEEVMPEEDFPSY